MSLLLDALNKTSGKSKPADLATPDTGSEHTTGTAGDLDALATTPAQELRLEAQEPRQAPTVKASDEPLADKIADQQTTAAGLVVEVDITKDSAPDSAVEIDAELDFDETEFAALLESDHQLSGEIQQAANDARLDAEALAAHNHIEELSEEIAKLPAMASLAEQVDPSSKPAADLSTTEATFATNAAIDKEEQQSKEAQKEALQTGADTPQLFPSEEIGGSLLIELSPEPDTLAEEMLHDAPLVQAYSQAQKKRQQIVLLTVLAGMIITAFLVYKTLLSDAAPNQTASSFDPIIGSSQATVSNSAILQEIDPDTLPKRLSLPEFAPLEDIAKNVVRVEAARAAPRELRLAYTALNEGKFEKAQRLYLRLADTEIHKVAALSGLASVAIARNRLTDAREQLQHVLSIDRQNTWAIATLAALAGQDADNDTANSNSLSQLKSMRAADPQNHQIAYLLGNRLAGAGIWTEAQAAYFDAFAHDSKNANYAFNLAIALDHLGKKKEAIEFYKKALQLAETRSADFDIALLRKRLLEGDR